MRILIQTFTGKEANPYIPALARLRIEVFREFPYLYEGDLDYEKEYLQTYVQAPESVIVVAFDDEKVIGASTGIPMKNEPIHIQKPWIEAGFDVKKIFYYGESVLQKQYRGQGLGVKFMENREAWAKKLGRFDIICFCAVIRPTNHPGRPNDYIPLDQFWHKRGFTKTQQLICYIPWKDLDEPAESPKALLFWSKKL